MFGALGSAVAFFWKASAGYRLRPWRSPYLRWRVETYSGKPAESLRAGDFLRLLFAERKQMGRFVLWLGEMKRLTGGDKT